MKVFLHRNSVPWHYQSFTHLGQLFSHSSQDLKGGLNNDLHKIMCNHNFFY